ncbi:MAG: hypothetical protein NZ899_01530 [Thermoguttaceae bacterium]|nr:hypothetical protein [Thermoguttaceae bacterium]MDW8078615.1 hypothetical protein [Thermoguttaceae bacterium]
MSLAWRKVWCLCRIVLVIGLGLVPALIIVGKALWIRSPIARKLLEQQITAIVGEPAFIQRLSYPRPGVGHFCLLTLGKPAETEAVCTLRDVSWTRKRKGDLFQFEAWAEHASLRLGEPARCGDLARDVIYSLTQLGASQASLRLSINKVSITCPHTSEDFVSAVCEVELIQPELRGIIRLWKDRNTSTQPLEIRFVQTRQSRGPKAWGFHTGDAGIPVKVIGEWLPSFRLAGDDAIFQGYVWQVLDSGNERTEVCGVYRFANLEKVLAGTYAELACGQGEFIVHKALSRNGKWTEVTGSVKLVSGAIRAEILHRFCEAFRAKLADLGIGRAMVPIDDFSLTFLLSDGVLHVQSAALNGKTIIAGQQPTAGPSGQRISLAWPEFAWAIISPDGNPGRITPEAAALWRAVAGVDNALVANVPIGP